ncbi:MAG: relaxase/mobilization nuclease domain-containing protein [Bacteroidota bacterium]
MAAHLFKAENDHVFVQETFGSGPDRKAVENALVELQLYTQMTKGKTGIFSVAINPREGDTLTPEQQVRAVQIIEEEFGLTNQPRIRVDHIKEGRAHSHVFWSTVDQENCKLVSLSHYKRRLQTRADQMTHEFNLEHVRRTPNEQTLQVNNADRIQQNHSNKKYVERKKQIAELWHNTDNAQDFIIGLRNNGYEIAKGDKSKFVLVTQEGQTFNLVRDLPRLVKTKDVQARFGELAKSLPTVTQAKKRLEYDHEQTKIDRTNKMLDAAEKYGKTIPQNVEEASPTNEPEKSDKTTFRKDDAHLARLDREREWEAWANKLRQKLKAQQEKIYNPYDIIKKIEDLEKLIAANDNSPLSNKKRVNTWQEELTALRLNFAHMQSLIAEQDATLETKIAQHHPYKNQTGTSNRLREKADELRRDFDALHQKYQQKNKSDDRDRFLDFDR